MSELVLRATLEQKNALEGAYDNGYVLSFVEDSLGRWVVNLNVLNDDNFLLIREELKKLPLIDYKPKPFIEPK